MANDAAMAPDESSMGIKSVDSVVAEVKADTGWCGGREKETKEVLMTENVQGTRVGIRDDVAWHGRQGKPVENSTHLVLQTPATYVDLGKPKGDLRPQGKNDVRFDLYHKALFEEGPSKSSRVRSAWDEKLGEVKVVDYREARLTGGKLTNLEYIIVYSLNDFAEERKACLAARTEMDARVVAVAVSNLPTRSEEARVAAPPPAESVTNQPAMIWREPAQGQAVVMNLNDLKREAGLTTEIPGSVTEARRGSTITVNTLQTKRLRFGSGARTEPGVAKIQITDAPAGHLSHDAFELVFGDDGRLIDVVSLTTNNEVSVAIRNRSLEKETITLPRLKGAGIPKEVLARLDLNDLNLEVVIVYGQRRENYHLKRASFGGAGQSFTLK